MKQNGDFAVVLRDLQLEIRNSAIALVAAPALIGALLHFATGAATLPIVLTSVAAMLIVTALFLRSQMKGRWVVLYEGDHLSGKTRFLLLRPRRSARPGRRFVYLYVGGKKALAAYFTLRLRLYTLGRTFDDVVTAYETLPPTEEVLHLVSDELVTDPVALRGVLDGEFPVEWAKAYSAGRVEP